MRINTDTPTMGGKARATLSAILQNVLVRESQLAASTRDYAWRVRGSPLQSIKRLFAEQGRQLDRWVTEIGACARAVGAAASTPLGSGPAYDASECGSSPRAAVQELLARHEAVIAELRDVVEAISLREPDGDAAAVMNGLLEFHETTAWMLRLVLDQSDRARLV